MTENILPYPANMKEPEASAEGERCPGCSAALPAGAGFCPQCGKTLTAKDPLSLALGVYAGPAQPAGGLMNEAKTAGEDDPLRAAKESILKVDRLRGGKLSFEQLEGKTEEELDKLLEEIMLRPVSVPENPLRPQNPAPPGWMVYAGPQNPSGGMIYAGPQRMNGGGMSSAAFRQPQPPQERPSAPLFYCHECGAAQYSRMRFCSECGTRLNCGD